ncbi:MAG: hypothetical protein HYY60_01535, partial [Parcubacteria group bacterium]|nr:hypothetical protein [Parcubacteria group bacterium]
MGKYSGRKISDVPWEELHVGMKVVSARGTPGEITRLRSFPEDSYDSIDFKWENGNESFGMFHI